MGDRRSEERGEGRKDQVKRKRGKRRREERVRREAKDIVEEGNLQE